MNNILEGTKLEVKSMDKGGMLSITLDNLGFDVLDYINDIMGVDLREYRATEMNANRRGDTVVAYASTVDENIRIDYYEEKRKVVVKYSRYAISLYKIEV